MAVDPNSRAQLAAQMSGGQAYTDPYAPAQLDPVGAGGGSPSAMDQIMGGALTLGVPAVGAYGARRGYRALKNRGVTPTSTGTPTTASTPRTTGPGAGASQVGRVAKIGQGAGAASLPTAAAPAASNTGQQAINQLLARPVANPAAAQSGSSAAINQLLQRSAVTGGGAGGAGAGAGGRAGLAALATPGMAVPLAVGGVAGYYANKEQQEALNALPTGSTGRKVMDPLGLARTPEEQQDGRGGFVDQWRERGLLDAVGNIFTGSDSSGDDKPLTGYQQSEQAVNNALNAGLLDDTQAKALMGYHTTLTQIGGGNAEAGQAAAQQVQALVGQVAGEQANLALEEGLYGSAEDPTGLDPNDAAIQQMYVADIMQPYTDSMAQANNAQMEALAGMAETLPPEYAALAPAYRNIGAANNMLIQAYGAQAALAPQTAAMEANIAQRQSIADQLLQQSIQAQLYPQDQAASGSGNMLDQLLGSGAGGMGAMGGATG